MAGVFDGSQMRVYAGGRLDGSKASTFAPWPGTTDLYVGTAGSATGGIFKGLIDEARVSGGALYAESFTPSKSAAVGPSTVVLLRFDGRTAVDSSGKGSNAVMIGPVDFSRDAP